MKFYNYESDHSYKPTENLQLLSPVWRFTEFSHIVSILTPVHCSLHLNQSFSLII